MTELLKEAKVDIFKMDTTPGLGPYSLMALPMDINFKQVEKEVEEVK